ncbi:response regulator transcription factor [Marinibaculum pumilum]|uniref:Response regulator transcription factor n=1 Tax=Marinibaculum pumilum TaxID=1766165 RepID=A0ABV7KTV5_9PROT
MVLVLVADDDQPVLEVVAACLEARGHDVVACGSGRAARSAMTEVAFEVAVLDILLPDLDGYELLRAAVRMDYGPRVLLMSAGGWRFAMDILEVGQALGADAVLEKPFLGGALESVVDRLAGLGRRTIRER